jgi:hypothetical protein
LQIEDKRQLSGILVRQSAICHLQSKQFGDQLPAFDQLQRLLLVGDVLIVRVHAKQVAEGDELDPRDESLLEWIAESRISALVADNYAVEAMLGGGPLVDGKRTLLPIHQLCLFKLGVPLGEMWYLHELATWLRRHDRSRFLLTAPPLRLPGIVGSPLTPIATV